MMQTRLFWNWVALATLGAGLALVGCGDDGNGGDGMPDGGGRDSGPADGGAGDTADVRFVHAAVGIGPVDVYPAGGTEALETGLDYEEVLGPIEVARNVSLDLYPAGTDPASNDPLYTFNSGGFPNFAGGETYTVVVRATSGDTVVAPVFWDAEIPDASSGEVGARFINATFPVEPFSVDTNGDGTADTGETQAGSAVNAVFSSDQRVLGVFDGSRPVERIANFLLDEDFLPSSGAVYFVGTGDAQAVIESDEAFNFVYIDAETDEVAVLTPDIPQADIRVLHASAGAPPVDVYPAGATGGAPIIDDLPYGSATGYLTVRTDVSVDIYPGDADPATDDPLLTLNPEGDDVLTRDRNYTLLAVGDPSPEADPSVAFRVLPVDDAFTFPGGDNFRARIVHASPTTPTVGIDVTGDDDPDTDDIALFDTFDVPLPTDGVRATIFDVTGDDPQRLTSFTVPGGALSAGSLVYVVAAGGTGSHPGDADAFVLLASPFVASATETGPAITLRQDPMLWGFHGVPDAAVPVDLVIVDDTASEDVATVSGITFGALTGRIQLSPATYSFEIRADGDTLGGGDTTLAAMAGSRYLVAAIGLAAPSVDDPENGIEFLVLEDLFDRTDAENARARGVHAAPDGSSVTVGTVEDIGGVDSYTQIPGFGSLSYTQSATDEGVALPPGTVALGVDDGVTTPTVVFDDVELTAGSRVYMIAAGEFVPEGAGETPVTLFAIESAFGPWTITSYDFRLPNLPEDPPPPT